MKKHTMKGILDEPADDGEQAIVYFLIRGTLSPTRAISILFKCAEYTSQFSPKGAVEQGLEEVLGLAGGLALLGTQPLEFVDDVGELLLEGERWERNWQWPQCFKVYVCTGCFWSSCTENGFPET